LSQTCSRRANTYPSSPKQQSRPARKCRSPQKRHLHISSTRRLRWTTRPSERSSRRIQLVSCQLHSHSQRRRSLRSRQRPRHTSPSRRWQPRKQSCWPARSRDCKDCTHCQKYQRLRLRSGHSLRHILLQFLCFQHRHSQLVMWCIPIHHNQYCRHHSTGMWWHQQ
jgi:hypothetical protein